MRGKDWKWNSDFFESQHDSSEYNFVKGLPLTDTVNLVPREEVGAHLQSQGKAPWWRGIDTVVGQTLKLKSSNILHVLFTNLYWPNNLELFGMNVILGINTYSQTSLQWRKCAFHNTDINEIEQPRHSSCTKILRMRAPVRWICSRSTTKWTQREWGGTWVFLGWVCAAWDSKLEPCSKKNFP